MLELSAKKSSPATVWLDVLSTVLPATGVLVVGAGTGNSPWVQWLRHSPVRPVLLVEGDKSQFKFLQHHCPPEEGWSLRRDIVADNNGEQTFHQASNPRESGLVPPEQLRTFWPNLQSLNVETIETGETLDTILEDSDLPANWLVLDCLPASSLLKGGSQLLCKLDVAVIRVMTEDELPPASLKAVSAVLSETGMRLIHLISDRHPGLAYAIYARDVAGQKAELQQNHKQLEQMLAQQGTVLRHTHEELSATRLKLEQAHVDREAEQRLTTQQIGEMSILREQHITELVNLQHGREQLEQILARQEVDLSHIHDELLATQLKLEQEQAQRLEQQILADRNISGLKEQLKNQKICMDELLTRPKDEQTTKNKTSDTSGFNEFIEDIEPYLFGKSITYVDVGAFVGEVFKFIIDSKKIRIREAHLIEPNPESYEKLTSQVKPIRIPALHTYNMGVSDAAQTLRFNAAASMTKAVTDICGSVRSGDSCDVRCSPLVEFGQFFTDGRIDLLKIDVEGHELAVLRGAEGMLQTNSIDIIYIEVGFNISGTQQAYFAEVNQFLQQHGYRCFKIYEQMSEWIQDNPWLRRCNFAYFSSRFAMNNPCKLTLENRRLQRLLDENG